MLVEKLPKSDIDKTLKKAIQNFSRKNTNESKDLFYEVLKKDPTNPEAHYYLGLMYAKDENHDKAVLHLKSVVDMHINFLYTQQCRMVLGFIYFKNKEYRRSEAEYLEVLKSKVNIVQIYAALSAIKFYLDEKDEAVKYAEKACDIDPFNLNAKNTLGFLLCEYELDVEKGVELLREVVRLKPNNAAYLDSLGWAYFKKGDKKAALASLKKALELSNDNEIIGHYGIVSSLP